MGLPAALDKLARLGAPLPPAALTPERVADYLRDYPGYRQRLAALWQQAQAWLPQARSPALARLRARLHLTDALDRDRWRDGPGQLFGALPHADVEAAWCPQSTGQGGAPHAERYRLNPSRGRVFPGRGWGDVLVVPYADLPGRICAFEFLGRDGSAADRVFRAHRTLARGGSNQYARQPPHRAEAGLAGLGTVDAALPCWGRTVFAVEDVALALRLQLHNCPTSLRPLPLVCWYDGDRAVTRSAWRVLADRPVIFWAWRLQPSVLAQAMQADGQLVVAGPEELSARTLDHYLRSREPYDRLRQFQRRARPWREAVRLWAEGQPDGVIEELLLGLESYRLDVRQLARECGGGRLETLLPPSPRPRTVRVGPRTVVERADGWYYVRRGGAEVPLINAVLRIDVVSVEEGALHYRGRILFGGVEVAYAVAAAEVERQPARWLREFLLRQGRGVVHFAPGPRV